MGSFLNTYISYGETWSIVRNASLGTARYDLWQDIVSLLWVQTVRNFPRYYDKGFSGIFNTLRPRQNGRHFPDDIFKWIFLNENVWISIKISLKFVLKGPVNNIPALVRIMVWRRSGDNPSSEPMMDSLPTHICVTRPQWVKQDHDHVCFWHCDNGTVRRWLL